MLEVEIKARVKIEEIEYKLSNMRAKPLGKEYQKDIYFSHPCRDFRGRDEALRVREIKDEYFLTYKGPKLDEETKTREEIKIKVKGEIISLLERLGFAKIREVRKKRSFYQWDNLMVCLDKVEGLGEFLEVEGVSYSDRERIFELLKELGISRKELIRKSYLEMLEIIR
jgi:adenylate cyclase class 2